MHRPKHITASTHNISPSTFTRILPFETLLSSTIFLTSTLKKTNPLRKQTHNIPHKPNNYIIKMSHHDHQDQNNQLHDDDDHHRSIIRRRVPQFPLDPTSYKILDEIGIGVSAIVYKAICLPMNSAVVAIKSIDLDQSRADFDNVRREAKIMSLLSHPNILNAHCSFTVDRRLWVVMPFMSAGSLQSIISSSFTDGFSEPCIAFVLRETLNALSYLHDQGHLHRDIKAGNILVDSSGSIKLADFGVSASIYDSNSARGCWSCSSSSSMLTDIAGTPYWMAPEVIHSHNGYGIKADIWSFGITALELAHGRPPLSHLPLSKSLVLKITKRFRFSDYEKSKNEKSKKFSKNFKEMVGLCLNQDPSKRPAAEKLLKHSFFRNCNKGLDFLVKNVLHGLPSVEDRFRVIKNTTLNVVPNLINKSGEDIDDDDDDEVMEKRRRISGWNFNEDGFKLDPVFPTENEDDSKVKQVRFGGETIINNKGGESLTGQSNPSSLCQPAELTRSSLGSGSLSQVGEKSREVLGVLQERGTGESGELFPGELGESSPSSPGQGQRSGGIDRDVVVQDLIFLRKNLENERQTLMQVFRLLGAEDAAAEATSEEYLERLVERLRAELESEKKRNSELELEVKFLKMQIQCND